jgi:hypothetical protein
MRDVSIKRTLALFTTLLLLAVLPASAGATATQSEIDAAVEKAIAYAIAEQDPATGEPREYDHSIYSGEWIATGYAAAGLNSADARSGTDPSLQDFLFEDYAGFWAGPTLLPAETSSRLLLNAYAAGIDGLRISPELNLAASLAGRWDPATGRLGEPTSSSAFGVIALRTTPLPAWALEPVLSYLRSYQHADGGWNFYSVANGNPSEPDTTAAAVAALCAAGVPTYDPTVIAGLDYLHGLQGEATGGIEYPGFTENVITSGWVVSALNTCGIDPQSSEWTTAAGKTPLDHLLSLQGAEGGFGYESPSEAAFAFGTADAIRALSGAGFAVSPPLRQNPSLPAVRPAPSVAAGTPVPHLLAIELAPGNVRICNVTAPVGAPLGDLLSAAQASSTPPGCVNSFALSAGQVTAINGVSPENEDESWLLRLDRGAAAVAGQQPVGFGQIVSLRIGTTPPAPPTAKPDTGAAAPSGPPGPQGARGKRGPKGRPGRNATIACKGKRSKSGKRVVRCTVRQAQGKKHRAG